MSELAALDAKEEGIEAAQVIVPQREKVTPGKVLFLLAGLGSAAWYFIFSDHSPFSSKKPEETAAKDEPGSAKHIVSQIKFGQMEEGDGKK